MFEDGCKMSKFGCRNVIIPHPPLPLMDYSPPNEANYVVNATWSVFK